MSAKSLFFTSLLTISVAASAHHGWSSYDATKTLTVDATLSDLSWGNPHGAAKTRYKGKLWNVILAPVSRMESRGLTQDMVGPKKKVRLVGYPRLDGTPEMRIERVIVGDKTIEPALIFALDWLASEIAASAFGQVMRSSAWAYPLANIAHLFGLALLAGGIMAVDIRVAGFWRKLPLKPMSDALTPFAIVGLLIFAASGAAMFAADAVALIKNEMFLLKLGVVGLALGNAVAFRKFSRGKLGQWNNLVPLWARVSAMVSLSLWSAAIICGRMIAYQ